jgi:hypothetical protein
MVFDAKNTGQYLKLTAPDGTVVDWVDFRKVSPNDRYIANNANNGVLMTFRPIFSRRRLDEDVHSEEESADGNERKLTNSDMKEGFGNPFPDVACREG